MSKSSVFIYILAVVSGLVLMTSIILQGVEEMNIKEDLVYDYTLCEHGEHCPFCSITQCICDLGWMGETCDTLRWPDEDYFPIELWNAGSQQFIEFGEINEEECKEECLKDVECHGISFVDNEICFHILKLEGKGYPKLTVGYEPIEILRRGPYQYDKLFIKNWNNCTSGAICHVNDDYGLVFSDNAHFELIDSFFFGYKEFSPDWNQDWFTIDIEYEFPDDIESILEITDTPFFVSKANFPNVNDITVMTRNAVIHDIPGTDHFDLPVNIQISNLDLGSNLIENDKKFDMVIINGGFYHAKSLPMLATNAFNLLKQGGIIYFREKQFKELDIHKILNTCSPNGFPKEQFLTDFMALFTELHMEKTEDVVEPVLYPESPVPPIPIRRGPPPLLDYQGSFEQQEFDLSCWSWDPASFEHPEHEGSWVTFVGKK